MKNTGIVSQVELTDEELQLITGGGNGDPYSVTSTVGGTTGTTIFTPTGVSSSIFGVVASGNGSVGGSVQSGGSTTSNGGVATYAQGGVGAIPSVPLFYGTGFGRR